MRIFAGEVDFIVGVEDDRCDYARVESESDRVSLVVASVLLSLSHT